MPEGVASLQRARPDSGILIDTASPPADRFDDRDFRLTDVHGEVIHDWFA